MGDRRCGSRATKSDCRGCRDDYYNHGDHSTTGQCWMLDDAKIVRRWRIGWWTDPTSPGAFVEVKVPNCYHRTGDEAYYNELPRFAKEPVRLTASASRGQR